MAPLPAKHVVWDTVGTVASYSAPLATITARLGPKLLAHNVSPQVFTHLLNETAEREYTFLSMSGRYTPYFTCMRLLFYRVLGQAGVPNPREVASKEDVDAIMEAYGRLEVREGVKECWERLRAEGFTMWAFTAGDAETVQGYLSRAGVDLPAENFRSCDEGGIGKPAAECYRPLLGEFKAKGEEAWFAAAHQWDASAAKRQGYKGAYVTLLEGQAVDELFGKMDVTADDFEGLADGIISASREADLDSELW